MNKNNKFHGAEFEINAQAISDDELDAVAGGIERCEIKAFSMCPYCSKVFYGKSKEKTDAELQEHLKNDHSGAN